jgi:septal ring factor EnvC (AmiA/AmiB activator)
MNWTQVIIGIATVFTGGGAVQLMMWAFKHKKEMKALDRTSAAQLLTSSSEFAARLQADATAVRAELDKAKQDIERLQRDRQTERRQLIMQLNQANEENTRLQSMVARLQTDLNIARGQIQRLEAALQSR